MAANPIPTFSDSRTFKTARDTIIALLEEVAKTPASLPAARLRIDTLLHMMAWGGEAHGRIIQDDEYARLSDRSPKTRPAV